jgi:hypothetical protein
MEYKSIDAFEKHYFPSQGERSNLAAPNSLQTVVDKISAEFKEKIADILEEQQQHLGL